MPRRRNRFAWYAWYPEDFYGDPLVRVMPLAARDAYRDLLDHSWRVGPLVDPPAVLAGLGRDPALWQAIRPCWRETPDGWVQPRLELEREEARGQSDRAIAANRTRWGIRQDSNPNPNGVQMVSTRAVESSPPPPPERASSLRSDATPLPPAARGVCTTQGGSLSAGIGQPDPSDGLRAAAAARPPHEPTSEPPEAQRAATALPGALDAKRRGPPNRKGKEPPPTRERCLEILRLEQPALAAIPELEQALGEWWDALSETRGKSTWATERAWRQMLRALAAEPGRALTAVRRCTEGSAAGPWLGIRPGLESTYRTGDQPHARDPRRTPFRPDGGRPGEGPEPQRKLNLL